MSKRKLDELEVDVNEYEYDTKNSRNIYTCTPNTHNVDNFESTHLHRTNKEMADFVRGSINFMRRQQEEIDYLKSIVHHLQSK